MKRETERLCLRQPSCGRCPAVQEVSSHVILSEQDAASCVPCPRLASLSGMALKRSWFVTQVVTACHSQRCSLSLFDQELSLSLLLISEREREREGGFYSKYREATQTGWEKSNPSVRERRWILLKRPRCDRDGMGEGR